MATRNNRLKPWPTWAGDEYKAALVATRRLRLGCKEALWRVRNKDYTPLKRLLPKIAEHARAANLAGLTAQAVKREHRGKRWPRWAIQALHYLLDEGGIAVRQVEAALAAANRRKWAEVERLLSQCLAIAQTVELLLLTGPPPDGVVLSKLEF